MRLLKLASSAAAVLAVTVLGASLVFAGSPGQLAQGTSIYEVKNITQNSGYAKTLSATCNDEVQYSVMLANTGYGDLNNVTLTATLPSAGGVSTATATTDLGGNSGTHDSVTVNLASGSQGYESGTTTLYDGNGNVIKTLPDTITTSGVNVGTIVGSTTEYVNFRAKVGCSTPAPQTFTATATATATANASAKASCPGSSTTAEASATASATATATATSNVSQAAAQQQAQNQAQQQASQQAQANAQAQADAKAKAEVNCQTTPTVTTTSAPKPAVKVQATSLPNTGAGDVLGLFTGTSAAGTALHYAVTRRRK